MKTALALILAAGITGAATADDVQDKISKYDLDNDGMLSLSEVNANEQLAASFAEADANGDGLLAEDEIDENFFEEIDATGDDDVLENDGFDETAGDSEYDEVAGDDDGLDSPAEAAEEDGVMDAGAEPVTDENYEEIADDDIDDDAEESDEAAADDDWK